VSANVQQRRDQRESEELQVAGCGYERLRPVGATFDAVWSDVLLPFCPPPADAEHPDPERHLGPLRPHDLRHPFTFTLRAVTGNDAFRLASDGQYLAASVVDSVVRVNESGRDGNVYNGDGIELMVSRSANPGTVPTASDYSRCRQCPECARRPARYRRYRMG